MQTAPLRYLAPPGRHAIIDALAPIVQSWFADTVSEPIPEKLVAITRRIDVQSFADDRQAVHRKDVVGIGLTKFLAGHGLKGARSGSREFRFGVAPALNWLDLPPEKTAA